MKTIKFSLITAVLAVGLTFSLSKCKKEPPIVVQTYKISGACTYPDYTNTMLTAKGAVLKLYIGTDPTVLASTFSDSTGAYTFGGLLPGAYVIVAEYNTENQNRGIIHGVSFVSATVNVTLGTSNATQAIVLATVAPTGTMKVSCDSTASDAGASYRQAPFETHSKVVFNCIHTNGTVFQGGFNVWKLSKFNFDEANAANIVIKAWVETSSINTFEPTRDALAGGCVRKTLNVDTMIVGGVVKPIPATDTIRFYADAGEVIKYGKGYLAHGHLDGFYKHPYGETGLGGSGTNDYLPADTLGYAGPYDQTINKPCDMYFEYQGKKKVFSGSNYNWFILFEGKFNFTRSDYGVNATNLNNLMEVTPHIELKGTTNKDY